MALAPADYAVIASAAISALSGLFVGFSGAVAFLAGVAAATAAMRFGWHPLEARIGETWMLVAAAAAVALAAFGLARLVVKKFVKNILAQPGDAILGSLVAAVTGTCLSLFTLYGAKRLGAASFDSMLLDFASAFLGAQPGA